VAGLIRDLKRSGLLESTLVLLTTEFGRTPFAQADQGKINRGRDHHPQGFTNVLIGAGLKRGFAFGKTDDIGYSAVENVMTTYDMHATILHLLGIDHERLTFYHNGISRRLTNVHGHVVKELLL
jgi:arylsulfatase A-like enzyme